jgi:hypothetical protein
MHTDTTLDILDRATTELGAAFRDFQTRVCPAYATRELARETRARLRRQSKNANAENGASAGRILKSFNLSTYKFHSLGDYVETIRRYGTTDSYSTEVVSLPESPAF